MHKRLPKGIFLGSWVERGHDHTSASPLFPECALTQCSQRTPSPTKPAMFGLMDVIKWYSLWFFIQLCKTVSNIPNFFTIYSFIYFSDPFRHLRSIFFLMKKLNLNTLRSYCSSVNCRQGKFLRTSIHRF